MKLGGQGDCRRRDRRWNVPATSRRKQRRPWFNTTTERIRPRHVHVAGGPSEGRRALVQRLSRGSQATSERHTEEALALTDWSGAPFPDEAVEGQGSIPCPVDSYVETGLLNPDGGRPSAAVKWTSRTPPSREAPGAFRGCPIHEDNADGRLDPSISRQPAHRPRAAVPPTPLRFGPTPPGQPSRPSPPLLDPCPLHRR